MTKELKKETIQKIIDEYNKAISTEEYLGKCLIIEISKRHNLYVQAQQKYDHDKEVWLDLHDLEMTGSQYLKAPELLTEKRVDNMHKFGWTIGFSKNFLIEVTSDELSNGTVADLICDSYKIYEIPKKLINESEKNYKIEGTI